MKKEIFIAVLLGLIVRNSFTMMDYLTARQQIEIAAQTTNRFNLKNCCNEEDKYLCLNLYCGEATQEESEQDLSCLESCWQRSKRNVHDKIENGWFKGFAMGIASSSCFCSALWTGVMVITKTFSLKNE